MSAADSVTLAAKSSKPAKASRKLPILRGDPLLGHLGEFRSARAELFLRMGKGHPDIVRVRMGLLRNIYFVNSPSLLNEILTTQADKFTKSIGLSLFLRPVLGDGLLTSEHGFHARQRRLLAPSFAPKRVASYASTMASIGERFATQLRDGAVIDAADGMMHLTFEIVGKTLFDADVTGDANVVGEAITTAMEVALTQLGSIVPLPPSVPTPLNLRYRRAVGRLDEVIYRIIRERRAQPSDRGDVLSTLLAARDEDGSAMTDTQVRDEAMTLFLAGHETTANALAWTFYLLAQNPAVRAKLEAEVDALGTTPSYEDLARLPYTLSVLKESMRLYPPAYMLGRRADADVTLDGHLVPKNSVLLLNVMGVHRRADLFPDPERFDPDRFAGDREKKLPRCAYLPFGAGPRVCIGNHFATMEGHLLLATIARQVRLDLVSSEPVELEPLVTLRPRGGLQMRVTRR